VDDGLPKYHMPLDDANKIIEGNMKLLEPETMSLCAARLTADPVLKPKLGVAKPRARAPSIKTRLGRIMHKLYELEPECTPEKPLKVDLDVDLYQMEEL